MIKLIEEKAKKSNPGGGSAVPGKVVGLSGFDKVTEEVVLKLRERFPTKGEAKILNVLLLSGSFSERFSIKFFSFINFNTLSMPNTITRHNPLDFAIHIYILQDNVLF